MANVKSLRIHLLGGFRVMVNPPAGEAVVWRQRRAAAIVKLLALAPAHQLHREQIMDLLWPELEPAASANNLRYTLHVARQLLEPESDADRRFLRWQGERLALAPDVETWIDVEAFELAARRHPTAPELERAVGLYTGDLLPEDQYEDWTSGPRERLRTVYVSLLLDLAAAYETAGDLPAEIATLEKVLRSDSVHEEASTRLMRAFARSGQRHRALRTFQQLRDALADELDVMPDVETQQLYGEILAGRYSQPAGKPEPATPVVDTRHNLSVALTRFIGREREVRQVVETLGSARLLTLTGVGGVGKTRLALAAAEALAADYPDGVWFVELGPLTAPGEIPAAIAEVLGSTLGGDRDDVAALAAMLGPQRILLALDNCEHIVEGCARIAEKLLQSSPQLRILATSREPLHLPGEVVWRVPPLQLPDARSDLEEIAGSEAVQLFFDRASAAQPGQSVASADVPVIADVCRRLDGLPFAIELAAARMPMFSADQLARLLSNPLQVLTGGSRTAEARQQTLRATLDWSFGLLDPLEQQLLTRLSVFAGGWTLDAAERICAGDGLDRREVLGLLAQLVDKSLVEARAGKQEARYRLLETVRQYAGQQLAASGGEHVVAERHASFMLELAENAEPGLRGGEQARWLEQLSLELDNVRSALHLLEQRSDVERLLRMASALVHLWWIRGYATEGRRWLEAGLSMENNGAGTDPAVRAKALQAAGNLARMQGDVGPAQQCLEECLRLQREIGVPAQVADALDYLASLLSVTGDWQRAWPLAEEGLALRRELADTRAIAQSLGTLGEIAFSAGDSEASSQYIEEALPLYRSIGDRHSVAITLNNLGEALRGQGRLDSAAGRFRESLDLFQELEAHHGVAYLVANLADIARLQGQVGEAHRLYLDALARFSELGYTQATLSVVSGLAALGAAHGQPEQAVVLFGAEAYLRDAAGYALTPVERADHDQALAVARGRLSEDAFTEAWRSGQGTTFDKAVTSARAIEICEPHTEASTAASGTTTLSARELEVALLVAAGRMNREIAAELNIGNRTADKHVSNILRKLGLASRSQLQAWVAAQGLQPGE